MRIIYFDIDTLRPDHMGCYGYKRNTTPVIDSIAREGVCFDQYYTPNAPCLPSRASLTTGQYGIRTGIVGHGGSAADMRPEGEGREFRDSRSMGSLFTQLRMAGFHTVSFSSFPERHTAWWFQAGLSESFNPGGVGHESAEAVTPNVVKWLRTNGTDDQWFLHVHYWDPHGPFRTPGHFGNPFEEEDLSDTWITPEVFETHQMHVGPHGAQEISMWTDDPQPDYPRYPGKLTSVSDVKTFIDNYDCGIRYVDDNIGIILNYLKDLNLYDENLAVIISADHGENLGELGIYGEHATADEATCRIPMIIKWPGGQKGTRAKAFHDNTDFLPTLRQLLNVQDKAPLFNYMAVPEKHYDGQSYAETLLNGTDRGRKSLVLTQCAHVCQRSARFSRYLYIRTYHGGYHLFDREMLFDLESDPHQQINLALRNPELCQKGAKIILDWVDEMMEKSLYTTDPLWTVMKEHGPYHVHNRLKSYIERLEGTPRSGMIAELKHQYARDLDYE